MYLKPRLLPLAPQISVDYVHISSALNRFEDFFSAHLQNLTWLSETISCLIAARLLPDKENLEELDSIVWYT